MQRYIPDGHCIYCPNPSDSDEHVLPLGLNGNYVLRSASCSKCRDITSKFEHALLRGSLAQLRVGHQFKTRRPRERPKSFPLFVTRDGHESQVDVSPNAHPLFLNLPLFPLPKLIHGNLNEPELRITGGVVFHLNPMNGIFSKHRADSVACIEKSQHVELARLLAKIAYGYLIGELGKLRVKGSYLLPIIFGDINLAGLYIGSSDTVLVAGPSDPAFSYQSYRLPTHLGSEEVAVVMIRLLPHMAEGPVYLVVCDLNDPPQLNA